MARDAFKDDVTRVSGACLAVGLLHSLAISPFLLTFVAVSCGCSSLTSPDDLRLRRALKRVLSLDEAYADAFCRLFATVRGGDTVEASATGRRPSGSNFDFESDPVLAALPGLMVCCTKYCTYPLCLTVFSCGDVFL